VRRAGDDNNSSFGKFIEELRRTKNRPIATKENNELIHATMELSVCLQGQKDNIYDSCKESRRGRWLVVEFQRRDRYDFGRMCQNGSYPAFGAIDMVHHESPGAVTQQKRVWCPMDLCKKSPFRLLGSIASYFPPIPFEVRNGYDLLGFLGRDIPRLAVGYQVRVSGR
jgi:hypothetical protein